MEVKIKQGDEMLDATIEKINGVMVVSPKEMKYMYKAGEVIVVRAKFKHILIYKESTNGSLYSFADLIESRLDIDDNPVCYECKITEIRPATEEEKKRLLDKLAEEGYEWKPDTKELVKLKWKPNLEEEYWFPSVNISTFTPLYIAWTDSVFDRDRFESGWIFRSEEECQAFCDKLNQTIEGVEP